MSMLCRLTSASVEQVRELLKDPSYITRFLFGVPPPTIRSRLLALLTRSSPPEPRWLTTPASVHYDLEKAWDGVRFLLTGVTNCDADPFPGGFLAAGGQHIGTQDLGYGPARAFTPSEVLIINDYLAGQSPASLEARFDPVRFSSQHIYPSMIWHRERMHTIGWLVEHFVNLRQFIEAAAGRGDGVIIHLS